MQLPIQIAFHNLDHSAALEKKVREKAAKLDKFCDHIIGCRAVVEVPHRHHQRGNQYQVRIDLTVPDDEIAANREAPENTTYRDFDTALRDAFDSARRQLEGYVRHRRGSVKEHQPSP